MAQNLTDWLGAHPWALWLSLVVLLGVAELISRQAILIMLAAGALVGAAVAAIGPGLWWLQILLAALAAAALVLLARRPLLARTRRTDEVSPTDSPA